MADLASIYSSSAKDFPLGHCMRLIPPVDRIMNPTNIAKFEELRHRQRNFQSNMSRISSWEIATLHSDSSRVPIDLQQRVMHIRSPLFLGSPLFHCVDKPTLKLQAFSGATHRTIPTPVPLLQASSPISATRSEERWTHP